MKKLLTGLLMATAAFTAAHAESVTLNFADLGLDNGATLTDYKVNDNLSITSTGKWNDSNGDYRLTSGQILTIDVKDATLTGVSINCDSGYGFGALSTLTVDSKTTTDFEVTPEFSWTGEASDSWSINAYPSGYNVRMKSITFTYTAQAVSQTLTAEVLCKDMGLENEQPMPAKGYNVNEYLNINFLQGTHAAQPTYRSSVSAFYIFNGQQVVVNAKNGAKILKIEIATTSNIFGYGGYVTADGEMQTYQEDYEWDPCEWEGVAEQNVIFTNGGRTGNTQVTGFTITYETPGAGLIVARPIISQSDNDNNITITCDTEGASIYYTLDGSEPTAEKGILYNGPFPITNACTVKAIATMEDVVSSVATLEAYLRVVDNLATFLANGSPQNTLINCPITVMTSVKSYVSIRDNKGNYALIFNTTNIPQLEVESGIIWETLTAKFDPYGEYGYVMPVEFGEVTIGGVVEPNTITPALIDECVPFEYVAFRNVTFKASTNYYGYYEIEDVLGDIGYIYNRFSITLPDAGDTTTQYDVIGIMSNDPDDFDIWPISFVKSVNTGVETIGEAEGEAVYYNIQGIRVDNPENGGLYIVVKNGKASKMIYTK